MIRLKVNSGKVLNNIDKRVIPRRYVPEKIAELVKRVEDGGVKEIIFALSPTMEGDTTNFFISRKLSSYNVKLSVIARGVTIGNNLEYADEVSLGRSIVDRTPFI